MLKHHFFHKENRATLVNLLFLILMIIVSGFTVYRAAFNDIERTDFTVYTEAARHALVGIDIYTAENSRGWRYVYPPTFAIIMIPFYLMPLWAASLTWCAISFICLWLIYKNCISFLHVKPIQAQAAIFVFSTPIIGGIMRGQVSILVSLLVITSVFLFSNKKSILSGALLACATMLKVYPVAMLGYFIIYKDWKSVYGFALTIVALGLLIPVSALGIQGTIDSYQSWINIIAHPIAQSNDYRMQHSDLYSQLLDSAKPRNQSLESLFLTIGTTPDMTKCLVLLTGGTMLAWMFILAKKSDEKLLIGGAFLTWNLLISPIAETHYFSNLTLPILLTITLPDDKNPFKIKVKTLIICIFLLASSARWDEIALYRPLTWIAIFIWFWLMKNKSSSSLFNVENRYELDKDFPISHFQQ